IGLQEINGAVNAMDQGTQQNAAMVEQSTAASHGLATEAAALNSLLGQFRIAGGRSLPTVVVSPTRPAPGRPAAHSPVKSAEEGRNRPRSSPARALGQKLMSAFGANNAPAAGKDADWTEF